MYLIIFRRSFFVLKTIVWSAARQILDLISRTIIWQADS